MLPLLNMEAPPHPQSSKQQHRLMRTVSISVLVMSLPVLYVSFLHVPPAALFRDTTFWFLMSNSIIIVIAADSGMLFFGSSSRSADEAEAGGDLPFVVAGGEPAAVKSSGVSVPDELEVIKSQALVVREQAGDQRLAVVAENDHAYALVDNREIVIRPSAAAAESVPAARPGSGRLTASRSLAAREERPARRRHGHGHRPSRSSHALVPVQDKSVVVVSDEKPLRRAATDRDRRPPPAYWENENETETEKESEYSRLSDEELNRRVEEFITRFNRQMRLQQEKEEQAAAA